MSLILESRQFKILWLSGIQQSTADIAEPLKKKNPVQENSFMYISQNSKIKMLQSEIHKANPLNKNGRVFPNKWDLIGFLCRLRLYFWQRLNLQGKTCNVEQNKQNIRSRLLSWLCTKHLENELPRSNECLAGFWTSIKMGAGGRLVVNTSHLIRLLF